MLGVVRMRDSSDAGNLGSESMAGIPQRSAPQSVGLQEVYPLLMLSL